MNLFGVFLIDLDLCLRCKNAIVRGFIEFEELVWLDLFLHC